MRREDPIGADGDRNGRHGRDRNTGFDIPAAAALIFEWASERHIRRRRDDRSYGSPDLHWAVEWGTYCEERGIRQWDAVFEVMDRAKAAADRREQWRFWKYLNEQVQHAAEQHAAASVAVRPAPEQVTAQPDEDPSSEWAQVKAILANRLDSIPYANWIARTCQIGRYGTTLRVWVPDNSTQQWLESEYAECIGETLACVGPLKPEYTCDVAAIELQPFCSPEGQRVTREATADRSVHAPAVLAGQPFSTWVEAECSEAPAAPSVICGRDSAGTAREHRP